MVDILEKLRRIDAYPKTLEDFRIKTYGGAAGKLTKRTERSNLLNFFNFQ